MLQNLIHHHYPSALRIPVNVHFHNCGGRAGEGANPFLHINWLFVFFKWLSYHILHPLLPQDSFSFKSISETIKLGTLAFLVKLVIFSQIHL